MNDQVTTNKDAVDVIERALSNPANAGFAAETVLENTLKSFGLTAGIDFVLQQTFGSEDGSRVRPDAIVFLPADSVLVIDSKASKFLLELAQVEDEAAEAAIYEKLSSTMNQHLKSLASKNYRMAVQSDFRAAGKGDEVRQLVRVEVVDLARAFNASLPGIEFPQQAFSTRDPPSTDVTGQLE